MCGQSTLFDTEVAKFLATIPDFRGVPKRQGGQALPPCRVAL